jgi:hypothetical protein
LLGLELALLGLELALLGLELALLGMELALLGLELALPDRSHLCWTSLSKAFASLVVTTFSKF